MVNRIGREIYNSLWMVRYIKITSYIYLNYFCKSVKREKKYHIYPHRGTKIRIRSNAEIILNGDLHINAHEDDSRLARSHLSLYENSKLIVGGYVILRYGTLIRLAPDAILEFMGKVTPNINLTIDCRQLIRIGNDTMMGSDVIIYDSNFHPTQYPNRDFKTNTSPVYIGEHVWIGTRAMIMKGCNIGMGSIIGANAYITGNIPANSMVACNPSRIVMKDVKWARNMSPEAIEDARTYVNEKVD